MPAVTTSMPPRSPRWLDITIGLLLCLIVINGGVAYYNLHRLREDAAQITRSYAVLEGLASIVATLTDAETGQRGYLITADDRYLVTYEAAKARSAEELSTLAATVRETRPLPPTWRSLQELIDRKFHELDATILLRQAGDYQTAQQIVLTDEGKQTMGRIRDLVERLRQSERESLRQLELADQHAHRTAVAGIIVSALAGIAALVALLSLLHRHVKTLLASTAAAHEQRELLRATLISIGDGMIATDVAGNVTLLNTVAQQLTGWTQQDALGRPLTEVFWIVQADGEAAENPALRALREGQVVSGDSAITLISRQGEEWPIEDCAAPIMSTSGELAGAVLVFREISQRTAHEAALREHAAALQVSNDRLTELLAELQASEELFHSLADSMPQLAWMARPDGHLYWYNRRWYEYTGSTPEQMEGWGWQDTHDPHELPRVLESWRQALTAGEPWEDTFPLRRHDGAMRWHLSRAAPLRNAQGEIVRWFGTNTDITERLEMENALREADHRKDEFLATLAHELRNPIAPISNALQVWPLVEHDREEVDKLRAIMERQIRQLTRLVDDLLDVSRITRGKIELRRQPIDLGTVISSALEAVRPLIDANSHLLEVRLADDLMVDGDVARLTQVIGNLLHNAAKYTDRGGRITVSARIQQEQVLVEIADNGVGIPADMLERIFEMFQQVDQSLDRSHGGLGLGLTLVKRLIELHGGTVRAHSEGEGRGSRFEILLPATRVAKPAPAEKKMPPRARLTRHRVLVVDDVYASAKTLAMMLESINQQVRIAHDGPQALALVDDELPDIIFLDIAMPGMSGYEVARTLRAKPHGAGLRLVALTGYGNEGDRREAIEAGFDHHLVKPTSIDQLTQLLQDLPGSVCSG